VPSILDVRAEMEADLVVMTTSGHDSLRDALWGSTTEQVVRSARCPVCAVPMVP
jgi:nucleotide-binding universal stress UspA family protein